MNDREIQYYHIASNVCLNFSIMFHEFSSLLCFVIGAIKYTNICWRVFDVFDHKSEFCRIPNI